MMRGKTDRAGSITDGLQTVGYGKNREGAIEQIKSDGYQPVNEVNSIAWQEIERQIDRARQFVVSGRRSCLYYYMIANQMGVLLLSRYSRQAPWRVLLHLYPFFFKRLPENLLYRYAELFQIPVEALKRGELRPAVYHSSRKA